MKPVANQAGQKVRFTGKFLRNTGQTVGGEGGKVFETIACVCGLCQRGFVAVDEALEGYEGPRHIAIPNLILVGSIDGSAS